MLVKDTFNEKRARRQIEEVAGKKFPLIERVKMRGIGSQRLLIIDASDDISDLLKIDSKRDLCNIELRKGGIVVRFQSKINTYAWPIPWHQLTLFRNGEVMSVYSQSSFVKVVTEHNETLDRGFLLKVLQHKAEATSDPLTYM